MVEVSTDLNSKTTSEPGSSAPLPTTLPTCDDVPNKVATCHDLEAGLPRDDCQYVGARRERV